MVYAGERIENDRRIAYDDLITKGVNNCKKK